MTLASAPTACISFSIRNAGHHRLRQSFFGPFPNRMAAAQSCAANL